MEKCDDSIKMGQKMCVGSGSIKTDTRYKGVISDSWTWNERFLSRHVYIDEGNDFHEFYQSTVIFASVWVFILISWYNIMIHSFSSFSIFVYFYISLGLHVMGYRIVSLFQIYFFLELIFINICSIQICRRFVINRKENKQDLGVICWSVTGQFLSMGKFWDSGFLSKPDVKTPL